MSADVESHIVEMMSNDRVALPPVPQAALEINRLLAGDDFSARQLAKVIESDQGLAAAVLRRANSSLYGGNGTLSLDKAVTRIGVREVGKIVWASSIDAAAAEGPLSDVRQWIWRQALTSAMLCAELAPKRRVDAGDAFVCGLLHDFGKAMACSCVETLIREEKQFEARTIADWLEVVEIFHVELGVVMAAKWELPAVICDVVSTHHQPELEGSFSPMRDLVALTDGLVALFEQQPHVTDEALCAVPGLSGAAEAEAIMRFLPKLPGEVRSLTEVDEPAPVEAKKPTSGPAVFESLVIPAPDLPQGEVTLAATATSTRSGGTFTYQLDSFTLDGLTCWGSAMEPEHTMVPLLIELPGEEPMNVHATVESCQKTDQGIRVRLKLFALPRPEQTRWQALYHRSKKTGAAA